MPRHDSERDNFRGVGHNPFFRTALLVAHGGRCAKCGKALGRGVPWHLHHLTYEHACVYADRVRVSVVRVRRGREFVGKAWVPQCERCFTENRRAFDECLVRTCPLCPGCHWRGHKAEWAVASSAAR